MLRIACFLLIAYGLLFAPTQTLAASFQNASDLQLNQPSTGDTFLSGNTVSVDAEVYGELFAAATTINITHLPARSAFLLAQTITDTVGSSYDLFAAANSTTLSGTYSNDVYVVGNKVTVAPGTIIKGNLYAAAAQLSLSGTILGNAYLETGTLTLEHAHVTGILSYTANQSAKGLADSQIGTLHYQEPAPAPAADPLSWLIPFFATVLTAGLLLLYAPVASRMIMETLLHRYGRCLGVGYAVILLTPAVITLLFITMIGYKLAILLLCIYVGLLTLASIFGAVVVGKLLISRFWPAQIEHTWLISLFGGITIFIVGSIPGLNVLLGLLLFPSLVGASVLARRLHT